MFFQRRSACCIESDVAKKSDPKVAPELFFFESKSKYANSMVSRRKTRGRLFTAGTLQKLSPSFFFQKVYLKKFCAMSENTIGNAKIFEILLLLNYRVK